jgi:hypothetical protein
VSTFSSITPFSHALKGRHAAKTVSAGILLLGRINILIRDLCRCVCALFFFVLGLPAAYAQGTAPTFSHTVGQQAYTLLGHDPAQAASTTIPTVLVPIELSFAAKAREGKPFVMAAAPDVPRILSSPIFSRFAFSSGNTPNMPTPCCGPHSPANLAGIHCWASRK